MATRVLKSIDSVAQPPSGKATVRAPRIAARHAAKKSDPPDARSTTERAEDALLKAILGAASIYESLREIASASPVAGFDQDSPPLLLAAPDGIAKLMKASSDAINMAIEGMRQLAALRSEQADATPGMQTVYAPDADYPLRAEMEAIDAKLKEIEEAERNATEPNRRNGP